MYCLLALLISHPEYQQRAQKDIDSVLLGRPPSLEDKDQLPYIESMIYELLRYIGHVPLSIPHETTEDTTLQGYNVPKDTEVFHTNVL